MELAGSPLNMKAQTSPLFTLIALIFFMLLLFILFGSGIGYVSYQLGQQQLAMQITQTALIETKTPIIQTVVVSITAAPAANDQPGGASTRPDMVLVTAGEFTMGSDAYTQYSRPAHTISVDEFWIDKYEVRNLDYEKCIAAGACQPPSNSSSATRSSYFGNPQYDMFPVIFVSWNDANTYCKWLGRRLPTEAEWEKAARGSYQLNYPWGNDFDSNRVNSSEDGIGDTLPVNAHPNGASPYGALNMAGNVWEWVADWYDADYYINSPGANPKGPDSGNFRVVRGGGYDNNQYNVGTIIRSRESPDFSSPDLGFRCAQ